MSWKRKIALGGLGVAGLLALLSLAFLYYAPRVVRTDAVRDRVAASASRYLGRSVQVGRMDFHLLPFPSLVFQGVSLSSEGGVEARTDELRLYPSWRNLLRGFLVPGEVQLVRPSVRAVPSAKTDVTPRTRGPVEPFLFEELSAHVLTAAALLSLFPPELRVSTLEGRLEVQPPGRPLIRLENVNLSAEVRGGLLHVLLDADSPLWRRMSLLATAQIEEAHVEGTLNLQGFHAEAVPEFFPGVGLVVPEASPADLEFDFSIRGLSQDYRFMTALARVPLIYRGGELRAEGLTLKGSFAVKEQGRELSIDDLHLRWPEVQAAARYQISGGGEAQTQAEVLLKQADVSAVRSMLRPVFPGLEGPHGLFRILRGGHVSGLEFVARGPDLSSLLAPSNWVLKGRGEGLEIEVPHFPFPISEATGNVRIDQGILSGKNLTGTIEGGRLSGATLNLDLFHGDGVFGLAGDGEISMKTLLSLLKEYIRNERVRTELFRLKDVYGRAEGRVALLGTRRHIGVEVRDAAVSLAVSHESLPVRIRVDRGNADYVERSIAFRNLSGSIGSGSYVGVSGAVGWAGDPVLSLDRGTGKVELAELLALIRRTPAVQDITSGIRSLEGGTAEISTLSLEGPLFTPSSWAYTVAGRFHDLRGGISALPGEILLDRADFEASTDAFALRYLRMRTMQAELSGMLSVSGYRAGPSEWNLDLSGVAGSEAVRYVSGRVGLPEKIQVKTPVSFSHLWVRHRAGEGGALQGTLGFESGVSVRSAIRYAAGDVEVDDLEIRDGPTSARMRLVAGGGSVDAEFRGTLTQQTLDRILEVPEGWWDDSFIEGEVLLHTDFIKPLESLFSGRLRGRGFTVPVAEVGPVHIDKVSLKGRGNSLLVEHADLRILEQTFAVEGAVSTSGETLVLDLDVSAEGIPWSQLRAAMPDRPPGAGPGQKNVPAGAFPLEGVIHLQAGFLELGGHTWRPFLGDLTLAPDGSRRLLIQDAALCDISSTGTVEQFGDTFRFDINLLARQQELEPTVPCLSEKRSAMTGLFDLSGNVKGAGRPSELKKNATGSFTMKATEGRIHKGVLLARILEVLTVTEVIKGSGFEDLEKGFAYDALDVRGEIGNGVLNIEEAVLDGRAMDLVMDGTIDLETREIKGEILVAPFTTVDAVVKRIPIVSYILDGSIVTVPLEVGGTVGDPTVGPMSVVGTGKRLLGLLGRVVGAPFKIIEPILPAGESP